MRVFQIIYIGMIVLGLGISVGKHGQPKEERYNGWVSLIAAAIDITILALGGFFK